MPAARKSQRSNRSAKRSKKTQRSYSQMKSPSFNYHKLWKKICIKNDEHGAVYKSHPKYTKIRRQYDKAKKAKLSHK